jgi:hypothetical protein
MVALADEVVEVSDKGSGAFNRETETDASGKSGLVEDSRPDTWPRPTSR